MKNNDAKHLSTFRNKLKETLIDLLKQNENNPIAIAINGQWGVGKTYFWKNELEPYIKDSLQKYSIYTSVFGKRDGSEIIQDLVAQFLKRENSISNKAVPAMETIIKACGINLDLNSIFNLLKRDDLQNTIVCIDDFERLSDKIPPQDILGLISELKENKKCWVIILYNKDHLNDIENKTTKILFEKYREKIFDYNLEFTPPAEEQFNLLHKNMLIYDFDSYKFFPEMLKIEQLFEKISVEKQQPSMNLRTLKKIWFSYELCLKHLELEKYPDDSFKKIYHYLLYPIIYAYHFELHSDYFEKRASSNLIESIQLLSPHTSMYHFLLEYFYYTFKHTLHAIQEESTFRLSLKLYNGLSPNQWCKNFLSDFVEKIISDTEFHNKYKEELQKTNNDNKQASISFFLQNKENTKAIPYMLGFRILNYSFDEEKLDKKTKSFMLESVMDKEQGSLLSLFDQWCNEVYIKIETEDEQGWREYSWVNRPLFTNSIKNLFQKFNIRNPQNKLFSKYLESKKLFGQNL